MALLEQLRAIKSRRDLSADQRQADETTRRSRFSDGWGRLKGRLTSWVDALRREGLVSCICTDLDGEPVMNVDVVDVDLGTIRTTLTPYNVPMVGTIGRVEVKSGSKFVFVLLLFNDGHWEQVEPGTGRVVNRAFTVLDVESMLEQVLLRELEAVRRI